MSNFVPPDDWLEAANLHATVAQLLSTVIHQVNNALQTIGGHAELLKTDPDVTATTKRRAGTITGVTDRTAAMLASFQVFTRPPRERGVHDLREVATQALAYRHYGLGRARIQAAVEGAEAAPVQAEARPLMQAVLNVILNSEQALTGGSGDGRIAIAVATANGRATLTVDDNGPGPSAIPEIDPRRVLGDQNRLGLGLLATRAIVARLGGEVSVGASPLGGARVIIALPSASPSDDAN